jgi:peptidoglycan/LPS O-acetylase OafA/YrhL
VAALGVAGFHLYFQNADEPLKAMLPAIVDTLVYAGSYGVQLFFVISGFVVALTLFPNRDLHGPIGVGAYFVRRSVRLDPTYWLILGLYAALIPIVSTYSPATAFDERSYSTTEIARNILYFLPIHAQHDFYMPVTWTLGLEVQFYLFFATTIALINWLYVRFAIGRDGAMLVVCALMVAAATLHNVGVIDASPGWLPAQLKTFVAGILIALAVMKVRHAFALLVVHLALMIAAVVALDPQYVLGAVIAVLIVLAFTHIPALDRLAGASILVPLGMVSYSVYLIHQLVGAAVIDGLQALISDEPGWIQFVFLGVGVLAAILASALLYWLIERPSLLLSKRINLGRTPVLRAAS